MYNLSIVSLASSVLTYKTLVSSVNSRRGAPGHHALTTWSAMSHHITCTVYLSEPII